MLRVFEVKEEISVGAGGHTNEYQLERTRRD